ncbi:MAG: Gfo/Idh/MocA family oxidoreductase [Sphaerochaetaceae bacterium]|nr:Gfo/Idh/MocA family oxidoreductase [Sphaerochaetaceae bacterium]
MRKVGFGIIGLGVIADFHAMALERIDNAKLVAAYDMVPGKPEAFAKKYGCRGYSKLEDFLNDPELEVVTIGTPSGYHLDPALTCIKAKKHVIIEKPLEITVDRCNQIINAAKENGVKVSGVFQSRFHDAARLIKKAVEQGRFGKITLADAQIKWFRTQEYYDSGAWRGTWAVDGGGALMNQGIHSIDLLLWLMGEKVTEVSGFTATLAHTNIEVEDTGAAVLRFANGAIGVIEGSTGAYPGALKRIEICGSEGNAVLEEESLIKWSFKNETPEDEEIRKKYANIKTSGGGASDSKAVDPTGHARQFEDFANAIINNTEPYITPEDAAKSVEIITTIYKSAQSGKAIAL